MPVTQCVYCRQQPNDTQWHPFCSERCRMADLGRWLQGEYRVPGASALPDDVSANELDDEPPGFRES